VVLLGMGGSSLAPEVIRLSFGDQDGWPSLHVLDSTDAGAIRAIRDRVDLDKTLFLVSTKSGGTIETLSLFKAFWSLRPEGRQFVAITDPGSGLADLATEHGFRRTFLNDPEIGGRYSALSYFGLVPAALMGADVRGILDRAGVAEQNCLTFDSSNTNSGLWLGLAWGELALAGRDKLTYVIDPPLQSFGLWVEQLIAESTGKHGKGIVPIVDEPVGAPEAYGKDRAFVHLRHEEHPDQAKDASAWPLIGDRTVAGPDRAPRSMPRRSAVAAARAASSAWVGILWLAIVRVSSLWSDDVQFGADLAAVEPARVQAGHVHDGGATQVEVAHHLADRRAHEEAMTGEPGGIEEA